MPHLNGSGPEGQGSKTGRGLGRCKRTPDEEALQRLGKGMGRKRKSMEGQGKAKRLKASPDR